MNRNKGGYPMKASTAAVLVGTLLYSGAVYASPVGPSWENIGMGAVGLLISAVGWYAKGVSGRVDRLDQRVQQMNDAMLRDYHPKADIKELLDEIKHSMAALHLKFEKFEGLYGR